MELEIETMGDMGIIQVIDDGVYVCICKVYYSVFKEYTAHVFVYNSNFSQWYTSKCCGTIIDNRSYAPIFVLEEKDRKIKSAINNMIWELFESTCIVEYDFKMTENDFS